MVGLVIAPIIIDSFLSIEATALLYQLLSSRNIPPNLLWMPGEALMDAALRSNFDAYLGFPLAGVLSRIGLFLSDNVDRSNTCSRIAGFEVWIGITSAGHSSSFLHQDVDEGRRLALGITRYPVASAILHVGPQDGMIGGQTFIWRDGCIPPSLINSLFRYVDVPELLKEWPDQWYEVQHSASRLIIFDGSLPHFVAPVVSTPPGEPRLSLLVNAWDLPLYDSSDLFGRLPSNYFQALTGLNAEALKSIVSVAAPYGLRRSADVLLAVQMLTANYK